MAFDEALAQRVRALAGPREGISEQQMFGGVAWMLRGNMAVGVLGADLIVRVGRDRHDEAMAEPGVREFDFTGRPMRGFVLVDTEASREDDALAEWVEDGFRFAASLPPKPGR